MAWNPRSFPALRPQNHRVTSDPADAYNCVAHAIGSPGVWWWPEEGSYWPEGLARSESVQTIADAFRQVGYEDCATGEVEAGREKVAIFADDVGAPTHAARQLPSGLWTSKLGPDDDIEHELDAVAGPLYGQPVRFMSRAVATEPGRAG